MTEHLPECPWFPNTHEDVSCKDSETLVSFCDALRACEQRVRTVYAISHVRDEQAADGIAFGKGYATALDDARKAVAAVEYRPTNPETMIRSMALDAIDALRGEP